MRPAVGTGAAGVRSAYKEAAMKPMTEQHLALFRRHMVEIIEMHFEQLGSGSALPGPVTNVALVRSHRTEASAVPGAGTS